MKKVVNYRFEYRKIQEDPILKEQLTTRLNNNLNTISQNNGDLLTFWAEAANSIKEAIRWNIPTMQRQKKQRWMTNEIIDLMQQRRQHKNKNPDE